MGRWVEELGEASITRGGIYVVDYENTSPLGADPSPTQVEGELADAPNLTVLGAVGEGFLQNDIQVRVIPQRSGRAKDILPNTLNVGPGGVAADFRESVGVDVTLQLSRIKYVGAADQETEETAAERTKQIQEDKNPDAAEDTIESTLGAVQGVLTAAGLAAAAFAVKDVFGD